MFWSWPRHPSPIVWSSQQSGHPPTLTPHPDLPHVSSFPCQLAKVLPRAPGPPPKPPSPRHCLDVCFRLEKRKFGGCKEKLLRVAIQGCSPPPPYVSRGTRTCRGLLGHSWAPQASGSPPKFWAGACRVLPPWLYLPGIAAKGKTVHFQQRHPASSQQNGSDPDQGSPPRVSPAPQECQHPPILQHSPRTPLFQGQGAFKLKQFSQG